VPNATVVLKRPSRNYALSQINKPLRTMRDTG
jgi:hypothetical protein